MRPAGPWPDAVASMKGTWVCRFSPCVGTRVAGWQFMQRGLVITRAASVNSATERAVGSAMPAKLATGFSGSGPAARPVPASVAIRPAASMPAARAAPASEEMDRCFIAAPRLTPA